MILLAAGRKNKEEGNIDVSLDAFRNEWTQLSDVFVWGVVVRQDEMYDAVCVLPHCSLLHLGTQEQVSEEKDMAEFTCAFRHLHQEAILHQLTDLPHTHVLYEHTHTHLQILPSTQPQVQRSTDETMVLAYLSQNSLSVRNELSVESRTSTTCRRLPVSCRGQTN